MHTETKERLRNVNIEALVNGGYVIRDGYGEPGAWRAELAAFSELEEALQWLRSAMA